MEADDRSAWCFTRPVGGGFETLPVKSAPSRSGTKGRSAAGMASGVAAALAALT
jgi:hypothetical protein